MIKRGYDGAWASARWQARPALGILIRPACVILYGSSPGFDRSALSRRRHPGTVAFLLGGAIYLTARRPHLAPHIENVPGEADQIVARCLALPV